MTGKIVHWEIMGPDGDALNTFYEDLFGWKGAAVPGFDGYHLVEADQSGVGGAVGKGFEENPTYLTVYVEVESINEHLAKVAASGGSTIMPRTVIPGSSRSGCSATRPETWSASSKRRRLPGSSPHGNGNASRCCGLLVAEKASKTEGVLAVLPQTSSCRAHPRNPLGSAEGERDETHICRGIGSLRKTGFDSSWSLPRR